METQTLPLRPAPFARDRALLAFAPRLLAAVFPLNTLLFLATGPHSPSAAPLFLLPIALCMLVDALSPAHTAPPDAEVPALWFDALLLLLAALQLVNIALLGAVLQDTPLLSLEALSAVIVVGSSSSYSGIVIAHELIHRPQPGYRALGRLLLCTVSYEHFYTEHIYGHHVRVGTASDPATARYGERGLVREGKAVLPIHAWDTDSWFTHYALTGLSRHADHHAVASRPYPELRHSEQSPKLPTGYLAMFALVILGNRRYQELMTDELRRKRLGPFAPAASGSPDPA